MSNARKPVTHTAAAHCNLLIQRCYEHEDSYVNYNMVAVGTNFSAMQRGLSIIYHLIYLYNTPLLSSSCLLDAAALFTVDIACRQHPLVL